MRQRPKPFDIGPVRVTAMNRQKGDQWYWRARLKGKRETVWTGWATREGAQIAVAAFVGSGGAKTRAADPAAVASVGDLVRAWKAHQEQREGAGQIAPLTRRNYHLAADYWNDALGDVRLRELRRADVELAILDWGSDPDAPVAPRTIKNAVNVLRQMMTWGRKRGLPAIETDKLAPKVRDDERVYAEYTPTPAEAAKMIAEIRNLEVRQAVQIMATTGARTSEIAALRRDSYDRGTRTLAIDGRDPGRGKRGKTGRRHFPLPTEARALVEPRTDGSSEYLFALKHNAREQVYYHVTKATQRAGVPHFTPHGLRRMVVMRLIDATDLKTVSRLTGHSVATLLRDYVRPTEERMREAVTRAALGSLTPAGDVIPFPGSGTGSGHSGQGGR